MSLQEFWQHWHDYLESPWGERRGDLHAALICETIANHAGRTRKQMAHMADYLERFEPHEPEPEPDPLSHFNALAKGQKHP